MNRVSAYLLAVLFGITPIYTSASQAQGLGAIAARKGKWELRLDNDSFSDEKRCVITYANKPYIQVSVGAIYFDYRKRGGVEGFEFRFNNDPSEGMRLPDKIERDIGMASLKGQDFSRLVGSSRFRIQILTLVAGLANEDLSIDGLPELYSKMLAACPGR